MSIRVYVVSRNDKSNYYMRYTDPRTGRLVWRSTGTASLKDAKAQAAQWQAELRAGVYKPVQRMQWDAFRDYLENYFLAGKRDSTADSYRSSLNVFEQHCGPKSIIDFSTERLMHLESELRRLGRAENTIARHVRHLKTIARWATKRRLLSEMPVFPEVRQQETARGFRVTMEQFDRMIAAVPDVVGEAAAPGWVFYLKGLLHSGLRLSESLKLRWDDRASCPVIRMGGTHPMLEFPPDSHKAARASMVPITPEFLELLQQVPQDARKGRVFVLLGRNGQPCTSRFVVGPMVTEISKKAGVVVKQGRGQKKFAGAHDLRRTFGTTWSKRVPHLVLRLMMRHRELRTTLKYYVDDDADAAAEAMWRGFGSPFGSPAPGEEGEQLRKP